MGGVQSTGTSHSSASDFERKKSQAAERMYRNHYSGNRSNFFYPRNLTFTQRGQKGSQDHLYNRYNEDSRRLAIMSSLEGDEASEFDTPTKLAYSPTQTHRGLRNLAGENNCFLNVTIQALWHVGPFRYQLQLLIAKTTAERARKGKDYRKDSTGLLYALCNLFVQYEYTELSILPPTELRTSLSSLFSQFQLGAIADANETLEAILETIHNECKPICSHSTHKCLSHTVFGGLLMEQAICNDCSSSSAPMLRSDYVHYVYAAELIALAAVPEVDEIEDVSTIKSIPSTHNSSMYNLNQKRFGKLLHDCMGVSPRCCPSLDIRSQPVTPDPGTSPAPVRGKKIDSPIPDIANAIPKTLPVKCAGKANVTLFALEPPMALAISVGWTKTRESAATLNSFLSLLSYTIQLSDLFDMNQQADYHAARDGLKSGGLCDTWRNDSGENKGENKVENIGTESDIPYDSQDSNIDSLTDSEGVTRENSLRSRENSPSYVFRGFVCYYGLHYVSVFQEHSKNGNAHAQFLLFDDQKIRPLGSWEDVKKECLKSLYQPVLLLYELQESHTCDVSYSSSGSSSSSVPDELNEIKSESEIKYDEDNSSPPTDASSKSLKRVNSMANKSVLKQMFEDADALAIAKQRTNSSSPPPYNLNTLKPTDSQSDSIKSLASNASTTRRNSMDSISNTSILGNENTENTNRNENEKEEEPLLSIKIYENRPIMTYVTLNYETYNSKKLLGIEHGSDENGNIIVVNFPRHPATDNMLPAEESGQIELMDVITSVENTAIENYTPKQVSEFFHDLTLNTSRQMVLLTIKSANHCNLWFRCPNCESEVCIDKNEEECLREKHEKYRSYSVNKTRSVSVDKNLEGSIGSHKSVSAVSNLKCYCPHCRKYCSADDIFHYESFM